MSTLKVNNLQVGQDGTAANNYTLYQPASPDGTVRLGYGVAGSVTDILTLKNSRLGIGTNDPQSSLHAHNDSGTTVLRTSVNANSTVGFEIVKTGLTTQSWRIVDGQTINGALEFYDVTDSTTLMIIRDGKVGIDTNNPLAKLQVKAGTNANIAFTTMSAEAAIEAFNDAGSANVPLRFRASEHKFYIAGNPKAAIDTGGRLLVNTSTSRIVEDHVGNGPQGKIQIEATNSDAIMSIISAGTADANRCGTINLGRHRNSTVGSTPTIVNDNDALGAVVFSGGDGTDMRCVGAKIHAEVDGTPGENDMPGALIFSTTPDGVSGPYQRERLRIDSNGRLLIGTTGSLIDSSTASNFQIASSSGPRLCIARNNTNVTGGNLMGALDFYGNDSDGNYEICGRILCEADGTHTTDVKPTRLTFYTTPTDEDTAYERLRITSGGKVKLTSTTNNQRGLSVIAPKTQIQWGTAEDVGGFLMSENNGQFGLSGGGYWNGSQWIATHSGSAQIRHDGGGDIVFATNASLSSGSNFSPAERLRIKSNGTIQFTPEGATTSPNASVDTSGDNFRINTKKDGSGGCGFIVQTQNGGILGERLRITPAGDLRLQINSTSGKFTMIEGTTSAFSFDSNGANGYFRLIDEYDSAELIRFHGDGALSMNTTNLTNYSQTSNSANTNNAGGAAGNWSWRRDTGAVIQATDADSGWALMYLNKYEWNSGDDNRWISFYLNGQVRDTINWNGSNIIYGQGSDYRVKENIRDFTSGIDKVKQLKVHLYDYIDPDRGTDHIGFIAHELQEIIPEAVSGEKDGMRKEEDTGNDVIDIQMVDYGKLTPVLTAALQEALAKIETLEARITALEG